MKQLISLALDVYREYMKILLCGGAPTLGLLITFSTQIYVKLKKNCEVPYLLLEQHSDRELPTVVIAQATSW